MKLNTEADRPASTDEIEITPEMFEAAADALECYYLGEGRYLLNRECLERIYRAMLVCRPLRAHPNPQGAKCVL